MISSLIKDVLSLSDSYLKLTIWASELVNIVQSHKKDLVA